MAYTPVRMTAPDGRTVLAGSPVEREQLILKGYRVADVSKPAPAVVKAPEPTKRVDTK